MIRKIISEFVGTMLLVFFGCGTAVVYNQYVGSVYGVDFLFPWSTIIIALAFGLVLTAIIAMFGRISGAHVNPAVSVACLINGRMSVLDCICYIGAQIVGACAGAGLISYIMGSTTSLGANLYEVESALGAMVTPNIAFVVELVLTFVFVLTVLSVTKKENCNSGVVIGLTLTLVHIFGLPFTGTSVNPARSLGPALLTGGVAMEHLWLFILAPMVGAILAALLYRFVLDHEETELAYANEVEEEMYDEDEEDEDEDEEEVEVEEEPKKAPAKKTTTTKKTTTKKTTKK